MNFTIIGSSGFIGRNLVVSLQQQGHSSYCPQRGDLDIFSRPLGKVFYCAGLTADYIERPFDTIEAHVTLLANILKNADFDHLIYFSSTRLYDSSYIEGVSKEEMSLTLNPNNPRHIYDLSKALGENLCLTIAKEKTAIARLSCVYQFTADAPGFLSNLLHQATHSKSLKINSSAGIVRDYICLNDVIKAIICMIKNDVTGIYNIASGENTSNLDLANIFQKHGWSITFEHNTPVQLSSTCDITKIRSLGVMPRSVHEVITSYLTKGAFNGVG